MEEEKETNEKKKDKKRKMLVNILPSDLEKIGKGPLERHRVQSPKKGKFVASSSHEGMI